MDYYDIAYETCDINKDLEARLGYKRIFLTNKDVKIIDGSTRYKNSEIEGSIFLNAGEDNIIGVLNASPRAVSFLDSKINKKALEQMAERKILLCLPISILTSSYGLQRSRNLYLMGKLFNYAKSMKISVSFVTLAKNNMNLCSYLQLIELAKVLGADEEYARKSISSTNKSLVEK